MNVLLEELLKVLTFPKEKLQFDETCSKTDLYGKHIELLNYNGAIESCIKIDRVDQYFQSYVFYIREGYEKYVLRKIKNKWEEMVNILDLCSRKKDNKLNCCQINIQNDLKIEFIKNGGRLIIQVIQYDKKQ